jgi:hypothetical protein
VVLEACAVVGTTLSGLPHGGSNPGVLKMSSVLPVRVMGIMPGTAGLEEGVMHHRPNVADGRTTRNEE